MKSNTIKVRRLYDHDPHCYWCGIETSLSVHETNARRATLDHVYSRNNDGERRRRKGAPRPVVLACAGCNKWRNTIETKLLSPNLGTKNQALRMVERPGRKFIRHPFEHLLA